jgi:hypothetical protein
MEHSEATESMAAARYLLGEMNDDEKNAFEEHFFGCGLCAEEVKNGAAMIDTLRSEGRRHSPAVQARSAAPLWLAAAAAVVIAILGYQNLTLRRDSVPRVLPSYSLLTIGTRGAGETAIAHGARPFALYVDVPPNPPYPQYEIDMRDESGRSAAVFPVSAEQARETVVLYVPGGRLKPGRYTLSINGIPSKGNRVAVGSSNIVVRGQ